MKKCINRRCNRDLQDDYIYCPYCGKNQSADKPKTGAEQKVLAAFTYAKTASQNRTPPQAVSLANKFTWVHLRQRERQKMPSKITSIIQLTALT